MKSTTPSQKIQWDLADFHKKWRRRLGDKGFRRFIKKLGLGSKLKKIKPTDFEMAWYKQFSRSPEAAIAKGLEHVATKCVTPRKPLLAETMQIHSHPSGGSLPTVRDIKIFSGLALKSKIRCSVIAVTSQGKLVGYTFMTIRSPKKAKEISLFDSLKKTPPLSELKKLGINIRFVPMPGFKFNPKTKRFIKI